MNITKIYGAPGCGKTTTLMEILEKELKRVDSTQIAFVSFTKKGTYEGVKRSMVNFNLNEEQTPYFRTLHSIAFRELKYSKYDVISKADYKNFSNAMGMRLTGYYTEEFHNSDDLYLFMHFLRRNNSTAADLRQSGLNTKLLRDVAVNFERYKKHIGVFDFTDIIERFIERNEALPVKVAIIDEAQDLTTLQWRMAKIAFSKCERVYIAGDDDQAIYEWSGADVGKFLSLSADTTHILDKSYRLPDEILTTAKQVSKMIMNRVDKNFKPVGSGGTVSTYNSIDEIKMDNQSTWYFLARNNIFLNKARNFLFKQAAVFKDKDKLSYNIKEIDFIKMYERVRKTGKLTEQEQLRLNTLIKNKPDFSKAWFDVVNFTPERTIYYRDLIKNKVSLADANKITVNTIHGVKGGEADNVVVLLDFTKAVKMNMELCPDSELRCLYVALTRAAKHLHLVHSQGASGYDKYVHFE